VGVRRRFDPLLRFDSASFTTLPHGASWLAMCFTNSSTLGGSGSMPLARSCSRISGVARTFASSRFSRSTISLGVHHQDVRKVTPLLMGAKSRRGS
jgi:hypothetical protein